MAKIKAIFVAIIALFVALFYMVHGQETTAEPNSENETDDGKKIVDSAPDDSDTAEVYGGADARPSLDGLEEGLAVPISGQIPSVETRLELLALRANGEEPGLVKQEAANPSPMFEDDVESYLRLASDVDLVSVQKYIERKDTGLVEGSSDATTARASLVLAASKALGPEDSGLVPVEAEETAAKAEDLSPAVDFSNLAPIPPEPAETTPSEEAEAASAKGAVSDQEAMNLPSEEAEQKTTKTSPEDADSGTGDLLVEEEELGQEAIKPSDQGASAWQKSALEPWEIIVSNTEATQEFAVQDSEGRFWTLSQIKDNLWLWFTEREVLLATLTTQAEDQIAQSYTIWSAHVWCYLNRIGAPGFAQNYSLEGILSAPRQFSTWKPSNLAKAPDPEIEWVVRDVFARSVLEDMGAPPEEVGRTLPEDVRFFNTPPDHGKYNWFYYRCWSGRYDPFTSAYNPYLS